MQFGTMGAGFGRMGVSGRFSAENYLASLNASWWNSTKADDQFQENVGPTAADDVGEAIGLKLDSGLWGTKTLAQVVAAASDIVTNGTFPTSINGWSLAPSGGGTIAWDTDRLVVTRTGTTTAAYQEIPVVAGLLYRFICVARKVSGASNAYLAVRAGSDVFSTVLALGNNVSSAIYEEMSCYYFASTTGTIYLHLGAGVGSGVIDFDNISVKLIPGIPAIQDTAASKPTVQQVNGIFLARGDGVDDHLKPDLKPTASMTLIEMGTPDAGSASDVLIGSQPAADGRAYLALDASGYLAGGVGTQGTATIVDQSPVDIRGVRCGKAIKWDGTTVSLFLRDASGFRKVYEAAQSGAVNTTVAMYLLGLNNNGTLGAAADSDTEHLIAVPSAIPDAKIAQIINSLY